LRRLELSPKSGVNKETRANIAAKDGISEKSVTYAIA
jgi:hypothetical protein